MTGVWAYVLFTAAVLLLLAADLALAARRPGPLTVRAAALWSALWVALALGFGLWVAQARGRDDALAYLAAYLTEESLSLDNMVVFVAIFAYFGIPAKYQHRVLFWGIVGALIMRGLFIGLGALLIRQFHWVIYVFGVLLVVTGVRMALSQDDEFDAEKNPVMRLSRRFLPFTQRYDGQKFFTVQDGRRL